MKGLKNHRIETDYQSRPSFSVLRIRHYGISDGEYCE
jgi:hypothetical protein